MKANINVGLRDNLALPPSEYNCDNWTRVGYLPGGSTNFGGG